MMKAFLNGKSGYMSTFFMFIPLTYLYFISPYVSFYPLWDGYYYFSILKNAISATTNLADFIGMFNLNSHPSMGYAAYISLGQLFSFNNQYILHYQNILLNLIAGYCFFYILIFFIGKNNKLEATLITAIFLFHPLNNATLLNFNLDYPLLIFFTTLIYSHLYKKDLLVILSGVMLVFSKETGIILYLSFIAALYLPAIFNIISPTQIKQVRNKSYYTLPILFLSIYFWARYFLNQSLLFSANGYGSSFNIIKELFTLDLRITWARLLQIFVLNFNWILSATVVLYSISLLNKKKIPYFESEEKITHFLIILFIFSTYLYTSVFLFKVAALPRYIIVSLFFLLLIFAKALTESFSKKIIRVAIAGVYLIFTILQNFSSIDPVSNSLFGTYDFGSHKIVKTDALIRDPYGHGPRDLMAYNLEFTVIDKLVSKLYKTIKVDESSYVITERMDHPSLHPKFRNQSIQPNVIILDELPEHINRFDHNAKIYYVHIPQKHNSFEGLNIIKASFKIIKYKKIEIDGYNIDVYELRFFT